MSDAPAENFRTRSTAHASPCSPPFEGRSLVQNSQTAQTDTMVMPAPAAFGLTYTHDVTSRGAGLHKHTRIRG
jgi:hypothetical protein